MPRTFKSINLYNYSSLTLMIPDRWKVTTSAAYTLCHVILFYVKEHNYQHEDAVHFSFPMLLVLYFRKMG